MYPPSNERYIFDKNRLRLVKEIISTISMLGHHTAVMMFISNIYAIKNPGL